MKDSIEEMDELATPVGNSGNVANAPVDSESAGRIQILNQTGEDLLRNRSTPPPTYLLKKELPHQRAVLELAAKGHTAAEIAQILERSKVAVQNVLLQPNLQKELVAQIHKVHGQDERVMEIVKESVVKAMKLYSDVIEDEKQNMAHRLAAAERVLERRYGKANQPINRGTDVDLNSISDGDLAKQLNKN